MATELRKGGHFDIIVADTPPKLLRDMVLVDQDDDLLTFTFRTGKRISVGRKFIVKMEEV